jgi:hypothetical protein
MFDFFIPCSLCIQGFIKFLITSENTLAAIMYYPQFMFCIFLIFLFFTLYFDFYTNSEKEDSIIDNDFLMMLTMMDAEEEIASLDDIIYGFATLFYVFA